VAWSHGYADGYKLPPEVQLVTVRNIVRGTSLPLTVDIEDGYSDDPEVVAQFVAQVIAAGAVGINIEDFVPGATDLETLTLQTDKIATIARAARTAGVPVVINARTDVFLRGIGAAEARVGVAIERGKAFLAAGADCVFVPGIRDAATIRALVDGIGGPINILAVKGTPPVRELEALGVARVSVGSGPHRATLALTRDIARELKTKGTYTSFTEHAITHAETNELME